MRTIVVGCGIALALMAGLVNDNSAKADPPPKGDAEKLKALLGERRDTLTKELEMTTKREAIVPDKSQWLDQLCQTQEALLDVDLELSTSPADRLAAYKKALEGLQKREDFFKSMTERGLALPQDYMRAKETRLKVEIKMTKERMKQGDSK
ncbi:MAG TPA: hypothetical protein VKS79_22475 [Gemmataceae bacterium]|nr:hypothetical protein [Gemmataceae bacterium]